MKNGFLTLLVACVVAASMPTDVMAKRLGGGGSAGFQRSMPSRSQDAAVPPKPAPAGQQGQSAGAQPGAPTNAAAPATGNAAAAAAQQGKRSWLGPIAGLAAGLGLAALMSHLGMGEAFANFLMLALLAVAAVFLVSFLMRRFAGTRRAVAPAGQDWAYAPAGEPHSAGHERTPAPAWASMQRNGTAQHDSVAASFQPGRLAEVDAAGTGGIGAQASMNSHSVAALPADFDQAGFERVAKMIFIRMQAANDAADLNDLRSFTTPEMFAHVRLDLQERGAARQQTDVVDVAAQVLDMVREDDRDIVSVRFQGRVREDAAGAIEPFDEVWHLTQPRDGSRSWAIAGIQQYQ